MSAADAGHWRQKFREPRQEGTEGESCNRKSCFVKGPLQLQGGIWQSGMMGCKLIDLSSGQNDDW